MEGRPQGEKEEQSPPSESSINPTWNFPANFSLSPDTEPSMTNLLFRVYAWDPIADPVLM